MSAARKHAEPAATIRPVRERDLADMYRWVNRPDIQRLYGVRPPASRRAHRQWFNSLRRDPAREEWAIVSRAGRHVGTLSLREIDRDNGAARLALYIGGPRDRGRGYGSAALRAALDRCFRALKLHRVWLTVYDYNTGALDFYRRFGFRREGVMRQARRRGRRYHDVRILGLLAAEWNPKKPRA